MQNIFLNKEELERYSRHLIIPEFNIQGQRKLKNAKVLIVGSGGLGSPLLLYLTAAGIGTIGIVDFDSVDISNLQRQVLFQVEDIGKSKALVAAKRLKALNPNVHFKVYNTKLNKKNALEIIKDYDIVADGTDNFPSRYLINDACVILGKPNIYGSIFRFEGQVSVFNYTDEKCNKGPNYRDLFPEPPPPDLVPSCAEGGVLGVLPGIIGSIQANEVIKIISGIGKPLSGKLLLVDTLDFKIKIIKFGADKEKISIEELTNYEDFCTVRKNLQEEEYVKEINLKTFQELIKKNEKFQLIDVREPYEREIVHINGEPIPHYEVEKFIEKIALDKKVILYCRSGVRSKQTIKKLQKQYGFTNLYSLKGGILAWIDEVDNSMPKY